MRKGKYGIIIIFLMVFCLFFVSCTPWKGYGGEYPQLFTEAIYSILGTQGFIKSEIQHQPVLELIETDEQGRKLFCYSEAYSGGAVSLLISQKSDKSYVYYYPDYNFISDSIAEDNIIYIYGSKKLSEIKNPLNNFTTDDIDQLKAKNDWGKAIDESKCIKAEIVNEKKDGPLKYGQMKELCEKIIVDTGHSGNQHDVQFFVSDDYGRSIYLLYGKYTEHIDDRFAILLLFNPDGTYNEDTCVIELIDKYDYQDSLKAFKELNNWNKQL